MALDQQALADRLKDELIDPDLEESAKEASEEFMDNLADILFDFVSSGQVTIQNNNSITGSQTENVQ